MPFDCSSCQRRAPLCDGCVEDDYRHLSGVAGARGTMWADRVIAKTRPPRPSWPAFDDPRVRARAFALVEGLTSDQRLLERLARRCADEAERRYGQRRATAPTIDVVGRC